MKRIWKRSLAVLLAVVLLVGAAPAASLAGVADFLSVTASAETVSGTCGADGDNVIWTLDTETGTLTISGAGAMKDYWYDPSPWNNKMIQTIEIANGVTHIGGYAFLNCTRAADVTIADSVTSIGSSAFSNCTSLTSVIIPGSVSSIGNGVFMFCTSLSAFSVDEHSRYYCTDTSDVLYNKEKTELVQYPVGKPQTSFTIPDGVQSIKSCSFFGCQNLKSVTIPSSVSSIGYDAFAKAAIVLFSVDANNTSYSSDTNGVLFNKGKTILVQYPIGKTQTSFTVPDGVTRIGEDAFYGCSNLISVTIPNSVTHICEGAFDGCSRLTSILLPDSIVHIGDFAFADCWSLTNIMIPYGVEELGEGAFEGCVSLCEITIPNSVTQIGDDAFLLHYDTSEDLMLLQEEYEAAVLAGETEIGGIPLSLWKLVLDHPQESLTDVYFRGTRAEWEAIEIGEGNDDLLNATIHFLADETPHTHEYTSAVTTEPTCSAEGVTTYTCSRCGDSYTETIPALGHAYSGAVSTEPTCSAAGVTTYTCSRCGDSYTEAVAKKPHTEKQVRIEPGCTTPGSVYTVCAVCGEPLSEAQALSPLGHAYNAAVTTEPTCTAEGVTTYTCARCGDSYTEAIAKTDHTPQDVTEHATCTADGRQYTKCSVCGETLSEVIVLPKIAHNYNAVVTKEATCKEAGVTTYTCTRCGDSYTEAIAKTDHTPQAVTEPATCTTDGKQYMKCSVCGETLGEVTVLPKIAHSFGDWVTVTEPTVEAEGLKERVCIYGCGTKETEVLPKIPTKTVEDTGSGVSMTYPETAFEGDVEMKIEQVFDGAAFNLVDLNSDKNVVFDITTVKDGVAVQPNGKVTVRIPVPDGFDPAKCMVYHVSAETGKLEKMPARYENGYMVFETDHFSIFAIATEKTPEPTVAIRNYAESKTVDYRTTITFTAVVENSVSGAEVHWFVDGKDSGAKGKTYTVKEAQTGFTVQAKYMKGSNVLAASGIETVKVNNGFFARLVAFFRSIFGRLPNIVQAYVGAKEHEQ